MTQESASSVFGRPLRLAVLLSGGGTTLQNLADCAAQGRLAGRIEVVVSSNPAAYGLVRAARLGIPAEAVPRKEYASTADFSAAVFEHVRRHGAELVCLAGFLSLLAVPSDFAGKIVNIHPALLPSFGGKGMFGHRVHEAVLAAGCKLSGCTVHLADPTYDTGPILVQRACPVLEDDTVEALARRVFEQECLAYPEAINLLAGGRVRIEGRRARILPPA